MTQKLTKNQEFHAKRIKEAQEYKKKLIKLHIKARQNVTKQRKMLTKLQRAASSLNSIMEDCNAKTRD